MRKYSFMALWAATGIFAGAPLVAAGAVTGFAYLPRPADHHPAAEVVRGLTGLDVLCLGKTVQVDLGSSNLTENLTDKMGKAIREAIDESRDITPNYFIGKLALHKSALHRCAPQGAAVTVDLDWKDGQIARSVVWESTAPPANDCIQRILRQLRLGGSGRCAGTLLVGQQERAREAVKKLTYLVSNDPDETPN